MEQRLSKDFVQVSYHKEDGIVEAKWNGYLNKDKVREGSDEIIKTLNEYRNTKHLSNQADMAILSEEVRNFLESTIFGELRNTTLKKMAVVLSESVFAVVTAQEANKVAVDMGFQVEVFHDKKSAVRWLNGGEVGS